MTPPPGLNNTLTPVSSPIIDGPICPLTFLLLQLLGQTPVSERREREEWVGKSRIRVSGTSAGSRELLFSSLSYFFLSIFAPLAVWIGLFSTSFILFCACFTRVSENLKCRWVETLGLRNGDGADRWILHAPLWSTAVKCCFVFEGWHRASQKGLLTWETLKKCLSRKHGLWKESDIWQRMSDI